MGFDLYNVGESTYIYLAAFFFFFFFFLDSPSSSSGGGASSTGGGVASFRKIQLWLLLYVHIDSMKLKLYLHLLIFPQSYTPFLCVCNDNVNILDFR